MTFEQFRKLSPAQQVFMDALALYGHSHVPGGSRDSGRLASAWFRTARSLATKGLIELHTYQGGGEARLAPGVTTEWMPRHMAEGKRLTDEIVDGLIAEERLASNVQKDPS
ncbi:MAG TPA: hypothetical protein VGY48_15810 [Vicinamibacterales bacterium]|nr:hypothetical protein [Vicinamibacterales bacterium]